MFKLELTSSVSGETALSEEQFSSQVKQCLLKRIAVMNFLLHVGQEYSGGENFIRVLSLCFGLVDLAYTVINLKFDLARVVAMIKAIKLSKVYIIHYKIAYFGKYF